MSVLLLIAGIFLFIGLILVHEWGHFIAARRGGVDVEEYGIFFPPRLFKKRMKGGWDFTINLIPLGGFVKLKGEHDTDTEPGSFGAAPLWVKTKIMAAGVVMNLLTAYVLLAIIALVGMPQLLDNQFTVASDTKVTSVSERSIYLQSVRNDSPADKAGLKADDTILKIEQTPIEAVSDLQQTSKRYAGDTVTVQYERDGKQRTAEVTLAEKGPGYLGVGISEAREGVDMQRSTWSAPIVAGGLIAQFTSETFQGLGRALAGLGGIIAGAVTGNDAARQNGQAEASEQVSGPVGIVVVLHYVSELNYQFVLLIIALISLTLAIMNILPIPALDGGRLWLTLITRALGKPLTNRTEEIVNATGFLLLILLSIVIAVVDVRRFF
ncbi:MAG TPA: M50 family metallopeptidase [Candidatus Saccharimonadales bacterium]